MRISSKKILAVVLSVAMLMSCMVFSFSSSAANVSTFNWKVDFESTAQQEYYANGNEPNNHKTNGLYGTADYVAEGGRTNNGGALQVSFTDNQEANYLVGLRVCNNNAVMDKVVPEVETLVSFWYKPVTVTGDIKVYSTLYDFAWASDSITAGKVNNGGDSFATLTTITESESGDGWKRVYAVLSLPKGADSDNATGVHIAFSTGAANSTILIDDIEVRNFTDSDFTSVNYIYNGSVVGSSRGFPYTNVKEIPALDMEVPSGYKMEFYEDENLEKPVDAVQYGATDKLAYVNLVKDTEADALYTETYDRAPFNAITAYGNKEGYTDHTDLYQYASNKRNESTLVGNGSGAVVSNRFTTGDDTTHGYTQAFINAWDNNLALTAIRSSASANLTPKAGASYVVKFDVWAEADAAVKMSLVEKVTGDYSDNKDHINAPETLTFTAGDDWQTVTLKLDNAQAIGLLMLAVSVEGYSYDYETNTAAGDYSPVVYVDNIAVTEYELLVDAVDPLVQGFEEVANGYNLKNDNHHVQGTFYTHVTASVKRTGEKSAYVSTSNNGGGSRAQFNIPTVDFEDFMVAEKDTYYQVTFWVKPNSATAIKFWLAAAEKDKQFANGGVKDEYKLYEEDSGVAVVPGYWNKITFTTTIIANLAVDVPVMRLGICSTANGSSIFYIDDLKVEVVEEDDNVWSFEKDTVTDLDATSRSNAVVSTDYAYTGSRSMHISTVDTSGRKRAQIYLKKADGTTAVTVDNGQSYLVSFWAYVPADLSADYQLNMWFAAWDGVNTRPEAYGATGDTEFNANKLFDDTNNYPVTLQRGAGWVKVTRYLENVSFTDTTKNQLLMSIGDLSTAGNHIYIDDISVVKVCEDMITENDRSSYLFRANLGTEAEPNYTNLHRYYDPDGESRPGVYTSIRLGVTYRSTGSNGSTMMLDGVEYEIAERGILVSNNGQVPTNDNYWAKSSVKPDSETGGFQSFNCEGVAIADAPDQYNVTYTLRFANMDETWFDTNTEHGGKTYKFRSYYVLKVKYYEKGKTNAANELTLTVYGPATENAFTFKQNVEGMTNYWFDQYKADNPTES